MVALDTQAKRVLNLFGKSPKHVSTTIGPEQEYFLIKEEDYAAVLTSFTVVEPCLAANLLRVRNLKSTILVPFAQQ